MQHPLTVWHTWEPQVGQFNGTTKHLCTFWMFYTINTPLCCLKGNVFSVLSFIEAMFHEIQSQLWSGGTWRILLMSDNMRCYPAMLPFKRLFPNITAFTANRSKLISEMGLKVHFFLTNSIEPNAFPNVEMNLCCLITADKPICWVQKYSIRHYCRTNGRYTDAALGMKP